MAQVIVVGGGLAGLSAAHTLLERGANVLLLDKQGSVSFSSPLSFRFLSFNPSVVTFSFMGGNSTKATSGINGAGTQTQQDHGIADSAKIFFDDTKSSVRILRIRLLI
jgi:succinate dehydrogenase/fumarate reductase flavoprotein subunit